MNGVSSSSQRRREEAEHLLSWQAFRTRQPLPLLLAAADRAASDLPLDMDGMADVSVHAGISHVLPGICRLHPELDVKVPLAQSPMTCQNRCAPLVPDQYRAGSSSSVPIFVVPHRRSASACQLGSVFRAR